MSKMDTRQVAGNMRMEHWAGVIAACQKMSEQEVVQEVRQIVELPVPEHTAPINAGKIVIRLGKAEVEMQGDVNSALVESTLITVTGALRVELFTATWIT